MQGCADYLFNNFSKHYPLGERDHIELLSICQMWMVDSRETQMIKLQKMLDGKKRKKVDQTSHKVEVISEMAGKGVTSVLDIGAGSGAILAALAKALGINQKQAFVIDVKPIADHPAFTVLKYKPDQTIPLPSRSVDLIIMAELLHHVHPKFRGTILKEAHRILKPTGKCLIQEHDYDETTAMFLTLDIVHNFWYVVNHEDVDPMYLMRQSQTQRLFTDHNFKLIRATDSGMSRQRTYWAMYQPTL